MRLELSLSVTLQHESAVVAPKLSLESVKAQREAHLTD